jgi:hypothetical protein
MLAGIAMLLLGLCPLAAMIPGVIPDIDWYHHKPTFLVMRDLRSSSVGDAYRAMLELEVRKRDGELPGKYEQQMIEQAMIEQASTRQTRLSMEMIWFLRKEYAAGQMTEGQKGRFEQQSLTLTMAIRPIVLQGDRAPFVIEEEYHLAGLPLWTRLTGRDGEAFVDGKETRGLSGGSSEASGLGSGGSISSSFECTTVGKHVFQQIVHVELRTGQFNGNDPADLVCQEDITLSAPFEVVAKEPEGAFNVIDDPTLYEAIRSKIRPYGFMIRAGESDLLRGELGCYSPSVDLAFDVIGRLNGREISLGSISFAKGNFADFSVAAEIGSGKSLLQPVKIDIILRSSEKVARETVNMREMWKGQIEYLDVPVQIDPKQ